MEVEFPRLLRAGARPTLGHDPVGEHGAPLAVPMTRTVAWAGCRARIGKDGIMDRSVFVGIDVSKERLDVHLRPTGERFVVARDDEALAGLVERLRPRAP